MAILDHRPRPYTILDDIVFDCDLSSLQKMTIITLFRFAGKESKAWPGVETLAKCTSSSARQVRRVLNDLQKMDLLRIERRKGQSSVYHLPEYRLSNDRLYPLWKDSTPDMVSPLPGHYVRGVRTSCQPTPDTMSPKEYQSRVSKKISQREKPVSPPSPAPQKTSPGKKEKNERENFDSFDSELIQTWSEHFSICHKPDSLKEQIAMDWMLFAARNNQLYQIKSPIAYLKTITRKGHSQDFIPFQMRKSSTAKPIHLLPDAKQKWGCINLAYKRGLLMEAEKMGIPEHEHENFAFQLFKKEYQNEQNQHRL